MKHLKCGGNMRTLVTVLAKPDIMERISYEVLGTN